jgi:chromosome segregation ATPase
LKRQLHDLNRELAAAGSHVKSCRQELDRHTRTEKDLNYRVQRAEDHAEALKDALEKENADDSQLDVLQNVLREHESEIELHEGSCRDADAEMAAKMQAIKEVRREINAHQAEQDILKTNLDVAESEKKLVESKRRKLLDDKNAAIRQIELDKAERLNVCNKREQVQRRVQEYTEKAGLVSARVPIDEGETPRSLERKLERLDRDLNRYNTEYVT